MAGTRCKCPVVKERLCPPNPETIPVSSNNKTASQIQPAIILDYTDVSSDRFVDTQPWGT